MPTYTEILFPQLEPEQIEILVAQLSEAGFEGFEEGGHDLKAFIPSGKLDEELLHEIAFKYQVRYEARQLEDQNWNQSWEASFQPVIIDDFAGIRASFHDPLPNLRHEIIITPKMSFGTGHHATTEMMIRQMRELDFRNKSVLDFGTGTGILSIVAEKLGAARVTAIDNDSWSIANAKENIQTNNCRRIQVLEMDRIPRGEKYDIILANLNKNILETHLESMTGHLKAGGNLLLSGVLEDDRAALVDGTVSLGLKVKCEIVKNNWICLILSK